jgi:hypothetical protein
MAFGERFWFAVITPDAVDEDLAAGGILGLRSPCGEQPCCSGEGLRHVAGLAGSCSSAV